MMKRRSVYSFRSEAIVKLLLLCFCWIDDALAWIPMRCIRSTFGNAVLFDRCCCVPKKILYDSTTSTTCCHLFTRPINTKQSQTSFINRNVQQYENVIGTNLPWTIELQRNVSETIIGNQSQPSSSSSSSLPTTKLSIRLMQDRDIESIVTMNVQEYGLGPAYFPWSNLALMESWIDRQYLKWLVDISCRMKLVNYYMDDSSSFTTSTPTVNDHAILVGVLNDDAEGDDERTVVGMIEVSLQPLNPQVTPSPIPIPIDMKRAMATLTTRNSSLVGWITNLLIVPQHRGYGYSKLLIAASEQMAKSGWDCTSIHLHCDADPISGMVPQKLYTTLGYRSPTPTHGYVPTSITTTTLQSSVDTSQYVVEIEGVPLLYLRKDI